MEFKTLINNLQNDIQGLDSVDELNSIEDCISWFKTYKKRIKSENKEWFYCKFVLKSLNELNSNLTKNQAYLKENSLMINNLYRFYVIPQGNQYNPQGIAPSLEELAIEEGYREEDI